MDYTAATDPFDYFVAINLHQGHLRIRTGRQELIVTPDQPSFYPLGIPLQVDLIDLGVQTLRLPLSRLEDAAELRGVPPAQLRFDAYQPVSAAMRSYWRAVVNITAGAMTSDDSPMTSPLVADEMARMAAVAALHTFPNTTMTLPYLPEPGMADPATLRRAVDYIDDHAGEPITVAQIAEAARISSRALQYAFRRHYDTTPLGYLRRVRLEHAHRELQATDSTRTTVAAVATRWGFAKPSRFAAHYQQAYGVPPSHTLRS